jgi:hypothetical protein
VKRARWLLLKKGDSLRPDKDVQFKGPLAANRALLADYVPRDA